MKFMYLTLLCSAKEEDDIWTQTKAMADLQVVTPEWKVKETYDPPHHRQIATATICLEKHGGSVWKGWSLQQNFSLQSITGVQPSLK